MAFDAHSNFGYSNVAVAPSPAASGTELQVASGQGALFPAAPFNCTVWPSGVLPLASNAEIVRVTAVVGDVLTIVRAQEGTSAIAIEVGMQIANTTSRKVFTDIEDACVISAGTQAATGPFTLSNANGVSFGMDNGVVTASVNTAAAGGVGISGGANSQSTGTVTFSNSNGITFGLDALGVMTASHNGLTQQTTQPVAASASNGSFLFSTLSFTDANGVTFGTSAGGIITASVAAGVAPGSISAGTQTFALGQAILSNANGITFGMDNGTITASHNGLTSQSNQAASASNGSFAFQTIAFSNANNVTFGTSAGGIITASVAAGGGGNFTQSILMFPNPLGNNTTNQNYQGTDRVVIDPFTANSPISFNYVQMLVTASVNLATASFNTTTTGAATHSIYLGIYSRSVTDSAATDFSNSSIISLVSSILWTMQISTSGSSSSKGLTYAWQTDSTGGSSTQTFSTNSSFIGAQASGFFGRILFSPPWSMSLPAGQYWMARRYTSSAVNQAQNAFLMSFIEMSWNGNTTQYNSLGGTTNNNGACMVHPGLGFYSTSTGAMPGTIDLTNDIMNSNIGQQNWRCYCLKP